MILVDVNLLVYAWDSAAMDHVAARDWPDAQLSGGTRVGLPWESTLGFLRIVTNARIFAHPATIGHAWRQVQEWLNCDNVWIPAAGAQHNAVLSELLRNLGGGPNLIPDAHLAALAIEHGLTLYSSDGDFARFQNLRWSNPLKR